MYRILKYITLIAILCLANPVTIAQSSNNNWISISGNTSFDILADTDLVIVYVPIKLKANISLRVISFDLFDVSLGNRHEMRLINAIKLLPYNNVGNVFGPAILIQLDLKQIKIQGPYNLQFLAMTKGMPDAYLNLTVNIPAATLRPEGPVVIDYASVLWKKYYKIFHRGSPKNFNEATLNLQEVSGKSRLTEIQIYSLGFYDANNRKIEGNLEFPKVPTLINPYGSSSGKYKLTGNFPLGTVNGKVEISAPQLATPLLVEFKVHKRITPLVIILITVMGLFLGYISRIWLQSKISNDQNRIKGFDLIDQMDQLIAKHGDKSFQKEIQISKDILNKILKTRDTGNYQEAITSAEQTIKTELEKLQEGRAKVEEFYKEFAELVQTPWSVPIEVEKALDDAKNELPVIDALIDKDNVGDSISLLNELHNKLLKDLRTSVTEWSDKMNANFQVLCTESKLPMIVKEKICQFISPLNTILDQIMITPNATIDEIRSSLLVIDNARVNIQKVKELLLYWLKKSLSDVEQIYEVGDLVGKSLEKLSTDLKIIFNKIEHENNLEQAIESLINRYIQEMVKLWQDFFIPQILKAPQVEQDNLMILLNKYDYLNLAHNILSIQPTKKEEILAHIEGMVAEERELHKNEITALSLLVPNEQHQTTVVLKKFYRHNEILQSTPLNRYLTMKELTRLKWLQTMIIGTGIAFVGYLLYEPNFIGKLEEMIQIFLWAFGLDVTFNTLIDQTKGVKKSST